IAAGEDDDVCGFPNHEAAGYGVEVVGHHFAHIPKALGVCVRLAIIDDYHIESGDCRNLVEVVSNMPGAKDVEQRRRQHWFDEDLERASANQAGVELGIVIQIESEGARLLLFHHLPRHLPNFALHAATADGTDDRAVITHQHLRGLKGRDRTANVGDGGYGSPAPLASKLDDFLVNVHASLFCEL